MSVRAFLGGKPIDLGPGATISIKSAAQYNREHGVTAYDFTFDASKGVVHGKATKVRSIIFDQRRRGR